MPFLLVRLPNLSWIESVFSYAPCIGRQVVLTTQHHLGNPKDFDIILMLKD